MVCLVGEDDCEPEGKDAAGGGNGVSKEMWRNKNAWDRDTAGKNAVAGTST